MRALCCRPIICACMSCILFQHQHFDCQKVLFSLSLYWTTNGSRTTFTHKIVKIFYLLTMRWCEPVRWSFCAYQIHMAYSHSIDRHNFANCLSLSSLSCPVESEKKLEMSFIWFVFFCLSEKVEKMFKVSCFKNFIANFLKLKLCWI